MKALVPLAIASLFASTFSFAGAAAAEQDSTAVVKSASTIAPANTASSSNKLIDSSAAALPANPKIDSGSTNTNSISASATDAVPTLLKGNVSHTVAPFKQDGSTETLKEGTQLNLTFSANLNSELSKVGDRVIARVSTDLKDGNKVVLPGNWYVVGKINRIEGRKRMGRDGYCEITFEKLVSPDCKFEAPISATISTKDSGIKTVATQAVKSTAMMSVGAFAGSLLAVQLTGIGVAISTYGLSVAGGAAVGATLGMAAFLKNKGDILCTLPGDELRVKLPVAAVIPAFNQEVISQPIKIPKLDNVNIVVQDKHFYPDPYGDKRSRALSVKIRMENHSSKSYSFENISVISDRGEPYSPSVTSAIDKQRFQKVAPGAAKDATITFGVSSPKYKYWLVLWDQARSNILSQVAIN